MTLNIFQRFLIFLVFGVIRFIQALELVSSNIAAHAYVYVTSFSFILFLGYGFFSGYFNSIADGVFYSTDASIESISAKGVLGTSKLVGTNEYPSRVGEEPAPIITAKSALVIDKKNNKILYEKEPLEKLAPASTAKLMTALVALELYKHDEQLIMTEDCFNVESSKVGAPVGSVYTLESVVKGMLIASSGDLACLLSTTKISADEFVYRMNVKARDLKMKNTLFTNAIGLDGENGSNFSTANDLYLLTVAALNNPTIAEAVATKEYIVKSLDDSFIGKIENTNKLLFEIAYSKGVKTGTTTEAGEVLIYEFNDQFKDLVIIVMGSENRFSDVRGLLYWTLSSFNWDK